MNSPVAARGKYWWNPDNNSAMPGWNSTIVIGEDLFNEIIRHPVPLDLTTLTALKRSTLGLDLYLWLVYRIFALRAPLRLTWRHLYCQFGTDPGHCHVNRVEPQRPAWIPFQAAALAVSHTLNASFRNRLNVSLLHK